MPTQKTTRRKAQHKVKQWKRRKYLQRCGCGSYPNAKVIQRGYIDTAQNKWIKGSYHAVTECLGCGKVVEL